MLAVSLYKYMSSIVNHMLFTDYFSLIKVFLSLIKIIYCLLLSIKYNKKWPPKAIFGLSLLPTYPLLTEHHCFVSPGVAVDLFVAEPELRFILRFFLIAGSVDDIADRPFVPVRQRGRINRVVAPDRAGLGEDGQGITSHHPDVIDGVQPFKQHRDDRTGGDEVNVPLVYHTADRFRFESTELLVRITAVLFVCF